MKKDKEIMKKIGSFLLAETIVLTSVAGVPVQSKSIGAIGLNQVTVYADEVVESGTCGESATYTFYDDGTLIISGTGEVDSGAFYQKSFNNKVKKLVINNGIESTYGIYSDLYNLMSIEVDENNPDYSSEDGVLFNKDKTMLIRCPVGKEGVYKIPDSVTRIANYAFDDCRQLINVEIPTRVTDIGEYAFRRCSRLESIEIPFGVTYINGFEDCTSLKSVKIPSSVTEIYGFHNCTSLESIEIPSSVVNIGMSAFIGCSSLTNIEVDENNENYSSKDGVLFNKDQTILIFCPGGKSGSYTIPDGVEETYLSAFSHCGKLTNIRIPASVTKIEDPSEFVGGCISLTSIEVDENNKNYSSEGGVLFNKDKTELLRYPQGISEKNYTIPDGVTSVAWHAFGEARNLTSVKVPASVTEMVTGMHPHTLFDGCTNLTEIEVDENNENYSSEDGVLFDKDKTRLVYYPNGKSGSYKIPDSVTEIGEYAFFECSGLTSVKIPDNVTSINEFAFCYCRSLTFIEIPSDVTSIGEETFYGCSSLISIEIPSGITKLNQNLFYGCSSLTTIYGYAGSEAERYATENGYEFIPLTDLKSDDGISVKLQSDNLSGNAVLVAKSLDKDSEDYKNIGEKVTDYLSKLPENEQTAIQYRVYEIHIEDENHDISSLKGTATVSIPVPEDLKSDNIRVYRVENDGSFKDMKADISNGMIVFKTDHFSEYVMTDSPLYSGTCGESATYTLCGDGTLIILGTGKINSDAFYQNSFNEAVKQIVINDGIEITSNIFWDLSNLMSINVDENNPNCSSEDGVLFNKDKTMLICYPAGKEGDYKIPDSVTSIADDAFSGCRYLTNIEIPNSVTDIGGEAFDGCSSLKSIEIPYGVTYIHGFDDCTSLKSIKIPSSVTSIYGFYNCTSLESIEIPSGVVNIGMGKGSPFRGCTSLKSVKISDSVETIGQWSFTECGSLTNIEVDENNKNYSSEDGVLFNKDKTELLRCPGGKSGSYTIPDGVEKLGLEAFLDCEKLTSVKIPSSISDSGNYAFSGCLSLTNVEIESGVTSIGYHTFDNCVNLTSIEIPESVTEIDKYAFGYNVAIKMEGYSITIYGYAGSEAERYATENGYEFIPLTDLKSDDGISVKLQSDNLSGNTVFVAKSLDKDSEDYKNIGEKVTDYLSKLPESEQTAIQYQVYEIHIEDENHDISPLKGTATVSIPVPEDLKSDNIRVYRVENDGSFTDMKADISNGMIVFKTDHFSEYVMTDSPLYKSETDTSALKGDLNGDGTVDIKDSAVLKRYLAGWDIEIDEQTADLNGDGEVDIKDSALLKRNLAGWDVKFAK